MAPPVRFDTEQIRDKARKDLLYLLSVVSKATRTQLSWWQCKLMNQLHGH